MTKTRMTLTPTTGLWSSVTSPHAGTSPVAAAHGAGLPFAGTSARMAAAQVAVYGARVIDLPGSPPRGAPV